MRHAVVEWHLQRKAEAERAAMTMDACRFIRDAQPAKPWAP